MAFFKIVIITLLASLAHCEPPVTGYYNGGYNNGLNRPNNNYLPPNAGYTPPNAYLPPHTGSYPGSDYNGLNHNQGYDNGHGQNHGHGHGHGHGDDNEVPKAYEFGYSVKDAKSGNDYDRREMSDGNVVRGEYRVHLPDGRTQIVSYHADWQTGFHADVRYEGEAQYPDTNVLGSGYNYNAPDFGGSLTGFHGNGQQLPKPSYGPPAFH
ncbi:pro-resilin-like [Zerene cesonia]|uniref:pro-resilin-like n=1 Tax=Zerene cesonia TaxID=33412 RepID=UPI0018E53C92|nr:pro-resilin-like [Zerene cesonia]